MTMTKKLLVDTVAEQTGLNKVKVEETINVLFEEIRKAIPEGPVRIPGFGTFRSRTAKARTVKGFSKEPINVPAKEVVQFLPAADLRNWVNA